MNQSKIHTPTTPTTQRFDSTVPFSHTFPFDPLFAERIPLLQAMHLAIANCARVWHQRPVTLAGRLRRWLNTSPVFRAVECGVYAGNSLLACAQIARDSGLSFCIHGLDTFTGLPPLSTMDESLSPEYAKYRHQTLFVDTSLEIVREKLDSAGIAKNVVLYGGLFSQTLPSLSEQTYHFVNIDCDLYEPHLECLEYFYPRMVSGGIVFLDDYHSMDYPMAGKAIDVFMKDKPEKLFHLRYGEDAVNRTKAFFLKY